MVWNYAELSKMAKDVGGPEKLVALIEESAKYQGRIEGRISMAPWLCMTALGASAMTVGVQKLVLYFKAKKSFHRAAVDEAKAELIKSIKEFDASHSDGQENDATKGGVDDHE